MKIKEITDVMTNSSSETFIIRRPETLDIKEFKKNSRSLDAR